MVHGRQGLKLEAWKFGVYIVIPIIASFGFNNPTIQQKCADYFQFLKYPANPNTHLKEEFEELLQKRELERNQRILYQEQLVALQKSVNYSNEASNDDDENGNTGQKGHFWSRLWRPFRRD